MKYSCVIYRQNVVNFSYFKNYFEMPKLTTLENIIKELYQS